MYPTIVQNDPNFKVLVFASIGDENTYLSWLNQETSADFFIVYYGKNMDRFDELAKFARFSIVDDSPSKFAKVFKYFSANPDLFNEYDYFWLPDDDVWINSSSLNSFFQFSIQRDLLISQPSVVGFGARNQLKKHKVVLDLAYTDCIEGMAPFFKSNVLATCLETFSQSQTGWGIDHIWAALIGYPTNKIAVVHKFYMVHTKRPGSRYGRFGRTGEEDKENIFQIYRELMAEHQITSTPRAFDVVRAEISFFDRTLRKIQVFFAMIQKIGMRELLRWVNQKAKASFLIRTKSKSN